jgi:hypothetical protein
MDMHICGYNHFPFLHFYNFTTNYLINVVIGRKVVILLSCILEMFVSKANTLLSNLQGRRGMQDVLVG